MELICEQHEQYRLITQQEKTWEVETEVIVPDTQADVYSIVTAAAQCQIKQKTVLKDRITVEGLVEIEALCREEEGDALQIVRGSAPFTQELILAGCSEAGIAAIRMDVLRCDAHIRNPRKLQLQAQLTAAAQLFQSEQLTVTQGVSAVEEEGIQTLVKTAEADVLRAVCEKKLTAVDEVQLSQNGQLLQYTVNWRQEEQRVLSGKVMLRGSVLLQTTFLQKGQLTVQEYAIPFSQVLECDGTQTGDSVTVEYQTMQTQVTVLEGDTPCLSCNFTGIATAFITRRMRLNVLRDIYSTRHPAECRISDLDCPAWCSMERAVPSAELVHLQERVISVNDCKVRSRGFLDEGGKPGGIYTFRLLYTCQEGQLHCTEHTVKVVDEKILPMKRPAVRAGWKDLSARPEEGGIRLNFTAVMNCTGISEQPCPQVSGCVLDMTATLAGPLAGTLVLRTIQAEETPWSIAKQYCSSVNRVLEANKLEPADTLVPGRLMIIPFVD